ncbi:FKBP-type peptidyl-prolyl cis-trans isomerase FklB [Breznakibacter xylanolyticus]|uniref:Peptidyl-prolyl cis-trans isomerase n=1 Tax=Breznakibacter xylanolyticus TaxID=990 RepID=A0A2W7PPJ8_9BACT|nr:FKBP-type peptidyl-prolyl cis-trans isomerase [Breznakibacter xylanolyticus]PZX11279.1 FKBP-type peptidyl-prolyl cis-trans isomerase FklB [Breznakibacter xylanolyticus]
MEKISYSLGLSVAQNLRSSGIKDLNEAAFSRGISHGLAQQGMEMTPDEANALLGAFFQNLQQEQMNQNIAAGKQFLEANAKNEGVVTLASGLQYQIITEGNGSKPQATDRVRCHYHGTLINGDVFDSSVLRGQPAVFPVNGVIAGWIEALQLMPVGSKWKLFIPSELAYGERGAGDQIGPHTTLIFEVELLGIE